VRKKVHYLLLFSVFLLFSCASKHEPLKEAGLSVPDVWIRAVASPPAQPWLRDFNSTELDGVVIEALGGSYDLRAVVARMEAARANVRYTGADRLPELSADSGATKTDAGDSLTTASTGYMDLGLTLAWELDIWGKIKNRARASYYDYEAARAAVRAARLSLAVNVARNYFDAIESAKESRLLLQNLLSLRNTLVTMEEGFRDGIFEAVELSRMRASVAMAESEVEKSRERHDSIIVTLETLIGRSPGFDMLVPDELPVITATAAAGLPSELLRRRPDIVEAEMKLIAKDELLKEARKVLLPDLTITASTSSNSNSFEKLLDVDYMLSKVVAAVAQPLFEGGRLRASKDYAAAWRSEALALYAATVLNAFKEVESALSSQLYLYAQESSVALALAQTEKAEIIVKEDYENGLASYIALLEAERQSFAARITLVKARNRRLQNRLGLYLALGGGAKSN
jgi:NodT family efflux transporter outer membrane factor (OMF) lipoprotein